jgi:ubiquinone/menaquinone biosynthesis C-methylase UbiE
MAAMRSHGDLAASWHDDPETQEQARSFGAVADDYDRVRPGYPAEVVRWALGEQPRRVLDLGAGTGKLTRVLVAEGHDVVAVEPDALMRERLAVACPRARVLEGTAEALPLPDASVDAVLVAQAWHWMDHERAAVELARVVRRGGVVVLLWNLRDVDTPLARAISTAVTSQAPELAERAAADGAATLSDVDVPDPRFTEDGRTVVDNPVTYSVADLTTLMGTWSYVALSPRREQILAEVATTARALATEDGTVVLDQRVHAFRFLRS